MADVLGSNIPTPNLTGFFSNTWIYVAIVSFVGLFLIILTAIILYNKTYNRKVVLFENIAGLGYQPTMRKKARRLRIGNAGEELLALLGGDTLSAYGRKMGKNTYWFAKGIDGYYYNFLLGDLDTKMAMLDIQPVDKNVRMFHVAKDRMNRDNYLKKSFMEKYGSTIIMFAFLIILILGMWFIIGKIGNATEALAETQKANAEVLKTTQQILVANQNIKSGGSVLSGIVPAS
jgi:Na+-transporting methylmalonyl-CoA/oxaloacetate decarboxylase gamma subunit